MKIICCAPGGVVRGVGDTPQQAYDNYKYNCHQVDLAHAAWNIVIFFEATKICVEKKGIPIITEQLVRKECPTVCSCKCSCKENK